MAVSNANNIDDVKYYYRVMLGLKSVYEEGVCSQSILGLAFMTTANGCADIALPGVRSYHVEGTIKRGRLRLSSVRDPERRSPNPIRTDAAGKGNLHFFCCRAEICVTNCID